MTNGEKFRQMSNAILAKELRYIGDRTCCFCAYPETRDCWRIRYRDRCPDRNPYDICVAGILKWLESESDE